MPLTMSGDMKSSKLNGKAFKILCINSKMGWEGCSVALNKLVDIKSQMKHTNR